MQGYHWITVVTGGLGHSRNPVTSLRLSSFNYFFLLNVSKVLCQFVDRRWTSVQSKFYYQRREYRHSLDVMLHNGVEIQFQRHLHSVTSSQLRTRDHQNSCTMNHVRILVRSCKFDFREAKKNYSLGREGGGNNV